MNRWWLIRRLRAPAFLILFGILALMNQWGVFGFRRSWPLFLILAGLLLLAERAALVGASPPAAPSSDASSSGEAENAARGTWRP